MTKTNTPLLSSVDPEIFGLIQDETRRQEFGLEMIPSENFVSEAVLEASGSVCTNKYAEGYPGKRYYGGCEVVDQIEALAISRAKELFGAEFANVQPHSGAQANQAVFEAFLKPGDTFMGMRLDQGGHLTHGSPVNFSGKHYKVIGYGVRESDQLIDMDQVRSLALEHRPKLLLCGATAYSRIVDWAGFRRIADEIGAIVMADIAHYSGLIAAGAYPSPVPYADVVTSTTHKTLRGPRSGMIFGRSQHEKAINKAVFPGLQGGPHMHTIAAKAVMLKEALAPAFREYGSQVVANARQLAKGLKDVGIRLIADGTDSHLILMDVRPLGLTGKEAEAALGRVGITVNKNQIPYDPQPPAITSGVRLGTPAITTRGMKTGEMDTIARIMGEAFRNRTDEGAMIKLRNEVETIAGSFPMYGHRLVR